MQNQNVTTIKRKNILLFNKFQLILLYLVVPKMKKVVTKYASAIAIISALRVKFLK